MSTRIDPDILKTEISFLRFSLSSQVFENRRSRVNTRDENAGLRTRLCHTSYIIALRMLSVVVRKGRKPFEYAT